MSSRPLRTSSGNANTNSIGGAAAAAAAAVSAAGGSVCCPRPGMCGVPQGNRPSLCPGSAILGDITNVSSRNGQTQPQKFERPGGRVSMQRNIPSSIPDYVYHEPKVPPHAPPVGGFLCAPAAPLQQDADFDIVSDPADPQSVAEYAPDIYRHWSEHEQDSLPRPDYMDSQPEVNAKMRAILVDWLVEVHMKYKLKMETLFLAVSVIDRFLDIQPIARKRLQLVGVAGMLIASKFEEIYPPETREFVYITDNAYSKEEVLSMEISMLTALGFNLCAPTAAHYFERYQRANRCGEVHRHMLQYILELTLPDARMLRYTPSHLVAAAALLSNKLLKQHPSWPHAMVKHTSLADVQVKDCARELCSILQNAERDSLQGVRRKFSQGAFSRVATHPAVVPKTL